MTTSRVSTPARHLRSGGGAENFRPEIQALRAVAVALVVLYHVYQPIVPGGFVGVDVFFVISGYLITSHLLREVDSTGTVSITRFWARRIRRLLPAAFTVLAVSFVAALVLLPRSVWRQTADEISSSALYMQNWMLAGRTLHGDIFGANATVAQHYWSLSTEEQFYLVWPLLIVLVLFLARKNTSRNHRLLALTLAAVFVISLTVSIIATYSNQNYAYFLTPVRAWEFAAGALVVFAPRATRWLSPAKASAVQAVASWGGLALIAAAAVGFSHSTVFPGFAALLPVAGATLVIWAGSSPRRWSPRAIASLPPVQLVGNLSYSIYLWHWPIVAVLGVYLQHTFGLFAGIVVGAASVLLAWATKRWVEDPVRTGTWWTSRRWPAYALAGSGMVVLVGVSQGLMLVMNP
jgi:peptidoglycan/LPS O-acetylase OafA/YrhL